MEDNIQNRKRYGGHVLALSSACSTNKKSDIGFGSITCNIGPGQTELWKRTAGIVYATTCTCMIQKI